MTLRALAILAAATLAACAGPAPGSPSPDTAQPVAPRAVGVFYVVHVLDDPGPYFDVRVDAVNVDGGWQTVATFDDVAPAGWEAADPVANAVASVGPTGTLLIHAERHGGANPSERTTLLLDVRDDGVSDVGVDGHVYPMWGPGDRVAWLADGIRVLDLSTGDPRAPARVEVPPDVEVTRAAAADGSGWLATTRAGDGPGRAPGVVTPTGAFVPGPRAAFEVTGLERAAGANGGVLAYASSDGVGESETAIVEFRSDLPGACACLAWVRQVSPGDDPGFGDAVWDAAGTGMWVPMVERNGGARWLSHVVTPGVDNKVAELPAGVDWVIAGVSADDHWIVLSAPERGSLLLVDTWSATSSIVARLDAGESQAPTFAGWQR